MCVCVSGYWSLLGFPLCALYVCVRACVRACVGACVTYQIRVIGKPMSPV